LTAESIVPNDKVTPEQAWLLQREKAVAWVRFGFAAVALVVIQINPERATRFPLLSEVALITFLLYSIGVLYLAEQNKLASAALGVITTVLDVLGVAAIVFSTGGTRTPFFFYYSFPVITASVRWGLKGSIPVALVGVFLYALVRISLAAESMSAPIGIDTLVVRSLYLILLACIFGYISEFERNQNQRLLALSRTAAQVAAMQERRRINFELHDGILQSLATLILRLEGCRRNLSNTHPSIAEELRSLEDLSRSSMKQIRQFLSGQPTTPLAAGTLLDKLREEARFLRDGMGLDVIIESDPEELALPPEIEREVYYVLREGLTNVTRHSHASKVEIQLTQSDSRLEARLNDNGVGFRPDPQNSGEGLGLAGMKRRIEEIGGELAVESSPGQGTRLWFSVILPQASGKPDNVRVRRAAG
jgi:signal transduction histidine kinase